VTSSPRRSTCRPTSARRCSSRATSPSGCGACCAAAAQVELIKVEAEDRPAGARGVLEAPARGGLRQKLKAIQDELGEGEDASDLDAFEEKIKASEMPPDVEKTARKQLERLKQMAQSSPSTPSAHVPRVAVELPWSKRTEDRLDLDQAREILDADHYDLKKVKKRILEYLAVRKLAPGKKGPILCLVGPPGVGKTSLGKSIARSLGREFIRVSLGGVRDEAEVAATAARTSARCRAGSSRACGAWARATRCSCSTRSTSWARTSAAIRRRAARGPRPRTELDVLGPLPRGELRSLRRHLHRDGEHAGIDPACAARPHGGARDPGYTREEKMEIAKRHLVPKQIAEHGLDDEKIRFSDEALTTVIEQYTREAGVRNLEREVSSVIRAVAVKVARNLPYDPNLTRRRSPTSRPAEVLLRGAERTEIPGVSTGLAWMPTGGDILFIEASAMSGKGSPDPDRAAR
jgi:ATP-dependent Lon protease